jgi:hypothetical protein
MIKLQLNFPGKANVGERRRTALEHVVQWNNLERQELAGSYELRDGVGYEGTLGYTTNKTSFDIHCPSWRISIMCEIITVYSQRYVVFLIKNKSD